MFRRSAPLLSVCIAVTALASATGTLAHGAEATVGEKVTVHAFRTARMPDNHYVAQS